MSRATNLTLTAYTGSSGYDQAAQDWGWGSVPSAVYKITLAAGAIYNVRSATYNDPNELTIYDQFGNALVINEEGDDPLLSDSNSVVYKSDQISSFMAPYSGTYYIDAGYAQSVSYNLYQIDVGAKLDNLKLFHEPTVKSPPATIEWVEDKIFTYTLPAGSFADVDPNTTLTYYAVMKDGSALPSWMNFDSAKGVFSGIAPAGAPDGEILVYAKDNLGLVSSPASIKIATPASSPVADISATLTTAYENIFRKTPTAQTTGLTYLIDLVTSKNATISQAIWVMAAAANETTSVATLSYQFFTGKIPGQAGMDYLLSPNGPNPNNLNGPYYQSFNLENRYINFAVNLGRDGEGKAAFTAAYGSLSLFEATREAYKTIFGGTPTDAKIHALIDSRVDYFAGYGGDGPNGIGTKAAMAGWLLAEAVKADVGMYAKSNDVFLYDLADGATFAVNLVGVYGVPAYNYAG